RMAVLNQKLVLDMIKEFRRNWHTRCNSERTTVCGADSMLLALQLSMAENNKQYMPSCDNISILFSNGTKLNLDVLFKSTRIQHRLFYNEIQFVLPVSIHSGEFTVSLSDVLLTWKYLLHEKLNLPVENMEVIDHYEDIRRTYESFLKNSNMLDLIDVYKKWSVLTSNCENNANMSPSQLWDFLSGRQHSVDDETDLHTPTSPMSKHNQDNEKSNTLETNESMMIISFLMVLGQDDNLGEIPNPSTAGGRILSVIKMQLIKCQNSRDPFYKTDKNIINSQQGDVAYSTTDISSPRPKSYAINHGIACCGRDTVTTLLVLLDEEAAKLLYDDENTIRHNGTSILTLFRSPTQVNNSLMKPLRERIHESMQEKKFKPCMNLDIILRCLVLQKHFQEAIVLLICDSKSNTQRDLEDLQQEMKQTLIRSQFACTYKDDWVISKDKWNHIHSASEPLCVLHMENDLSEGVNSSVGRPTIGTSSGNVHLDRSKNEKVARKSSSQTGNKSSKRKQVYLDDETILCDNGNELPQHKNVKIPKTSNDLQNKLDGKLARVAKSNKCTAKDKLITGQTKLTQFFRL
ncbi:hypothetical protein HPG69_001155, partial [Diceros bicornis minor]